MLKVGNRGVDLRRTALELFHGAFRSIDPEVAVDTAVRLREDELSICGEILNLRNFAEIYVISFGKAAVKMAIAIDRILTERISAGIVSAPISDVTFPEKWRTFAGGHPWPNRESLAAASAALDLLEKADHERALVVFLVSGGGSAMLEISRDPKVSFDDLIQTHQILVKCGAPISEVNRFRKLLSGVKGGQLGRAAHRAQKVTLIISDTNTGDSSSVASGPTIPGQKEEEHYFDAAGFLRKYDLIEALPKTVIEFVSGVHEVGPRLTNDQKKHLVFTLLDNRTAVHAVAEMARDLGFVTEIADDLVETPITDGSSELVKRLIRLKLNNQGKPVALISGGEFLCPVRGTGIGGRNQETVLRCLIEIERQGTRDFEFAILSAGTDGIDGNSPAAGCVADQTSLTKAEKLGLEPGVFLRESNSYQFFHTLGDVIMTGPTGTNVRDLRILLAGTDH